MSACDPRRCAIVAFRARSPRTSAAIPRISRCGGRDSEALSRILFHRHASLIAPRLRMARCIRPFGFGWGRDDRPCYTYYNESGSMKPSHPKQYRIMLRLI